MVELGLLLFRFFTPSHLDFLSAQWPSLRMELEINPITIVSLDPPPTVRRCTGNYLGWGMLRIELSPDQIFILSDGCLLFYDLFLVRHLFPKRSDTACAWGFLWGSPLPSPYWTFRITPSCKFLRTLQNQEKMPSEVPLCLLHWNVCLLIISTSELEGEGWIHLTHAIPSGR